MRTAETEIYIHVRRNQMEISPVSSFLCQQFFELAQSDDPPLDRRPVRDLLLAEVIRHNCVFTRLLFSGFMSADEEKNQKRNAKQLRKPETFPLGQFPVNTNIH